MGNATPILQTTDYKNINSLSYRHKLALIRAALINYAKSTSQEFEDSILEKYTKFIFNSAWDIFINKGFLAAWDYIHEGQHGFELHNVRVPQTTLNREDFNSLTQQINEEFDLLNLNSAERINLLVRLGGIKTLGEYVIDEFPFLWVNKYDNVGGELNPAFLTHLLKVFSRYLRLVQYADVAKVKSGVEVIDHCAKTFKRMYAEE